jgi:hypothetical protein
MHNTRNCAIKKYLVSEVRGKGETYNLFLSKHSPNISPRFLGIGFTRLKKSHLEIKIIINLDLTLRILHYGT